ncbi:MlaD family protein [Maribellus maritimus]|uniref:MlaD family protein n=1 Tax=Maribellus maritimus TaxID=2870838 RepID=UPI001EEC99F7|nr:MlaD family protein [Maribellus maritimus]MCG6187629.1 MlaD family protein [Maribellus maritimus]
MKIKISKYARLGILIVTSITILIWGLSYLKGNDIFKQNKYYHVIYERIDGLDVSNKVTLNGYQVGQVKEISFTPDNSGKLIVTLMIDADFRIPVNSVAQIISADIMGTRSVKLVLSKETEIYSSNDTIPGAVEADLKEQVSMQVLPIKNKAEELLGTLDSAITVLTVIFNEDARQNLSESFENINQTIENLEKTTADLNEIVSTEKGSIQRIIVNVDEITTTFKENTGELEKTIQNLSAFSDTLAQVSVSPVLTNLQNASNQLLATIEKLNSDDNSAGLLLNDDELYYSINTLSEDLSSLISDIQTNPKRYLHFSALDLGKEVYITAAGDAASKNIIFKVHLISTENQIPLNSKIFDGLGTEVEEYSTSGAYSYLTGATNSYNEIIELQKKVKRNFPDATVVAFKNGRLIKLKKALKSLR